MIKIVYGPKGFGKTKIMIDEVNKASSEARGNVVFISDKSFNTVNINFNVRCCSTDDYDIDTAQAFKGFINGLLAGNSDIEYIFIDGLKRIIGDNLRGGKILFKSIRQLKKDYPNLKFVISVSSTKEALPSYISRYVD